MYSTKTNQFEVKFKSKKKIKGNKIKTINLWEEKSLKDSLFRVFIIKVKVYIQKKNKQQFPGTKFTIYQFGCSVEASLL